MGNTDYTTLTLQELYTAYTSLDKEKYPEEANKIFEVIQKKEKGELVLQPKYNLASPTDRLAAVLVDGVIIGLPILVFLFAYFGFSGMFDMVRKYGILYSLVVTIISQIIYFSVNGIMLYKYGQTIGKKVMGIKIVKLDNSLPQLTNSYILRYLIPSIFPIIPFVGSMIGLADILCIFKSDRRCIHDLMAGTRVVEV